jgi:DNA repair exonuclease SbcCD nuclease subunit
MVTNSIDLVFIKDPHTLIGFPFPANRFETFHDEIAKKWEFILNYCEKNSINQLITTGDMYDKMNISQWDMKIFIKNKEFLEMIKEKLGGNSLISIRGNHDQFNGQTQNKNSVFGLFVELGLIDYFGDENDINCKEYVLDNKKIKMYGFDYKNTNQELYDKIETFSFDADYNIAVTHSAVVDVANGKENFDCVGYDYLIKQNKNVNMWVLGHYHKGYETKFHKNTYFINPWNLTRLARVDYVLSDEHVPEFVHVKFSIQNGMLDVNVKNIKIPCLKYKEVFKSDTATTTEMLINEFTFFTKLEEEVKENFDEFSQLEELKNSNRISKEVFDIIKENLL